jgi:hypothetical protein
MSRKKLNKKLLKELLDKETFAYKAGNDFGDGKEYNTNQISTNKTGDDLAQMVVQDPSNTLPTDFIRNGYLRETKSIAEAILSKLGSEDNDVISKEDAEDADLIDKANNHVKSLKKTLNKIDFKLVDEKTKEELLNRIKNG